MSGFRFNLPLTARWRIVTFSLLAVILLIALDSSFSLNAPVIGQGMTPTATTTPVGTVTPSPTPTSTPSWPTAPPGLGTTASEDVGLFSEVDGDPPPSTDVETIASRLVGIDFRQLAEVTKPPVGPKDPATGEPPPPQTLVLNLFDDVVFTGIVEHVERTSSGHALWGGIEGVKLGTMTLVVNGSVVVGTVRTPDAVYTIRTAGGGAYVVRQIDESSLPPLGEPLRGSIPEPDSPPPVRPQVRGPDAPDGTSTPTSTPTPVPTVATSPSKPAPDEAMASGLFSEVEGDSPPSPGVDTLASRLVEIDFGQLSQVTKSQVGPKGPVTGKPTEPQALVLNLFDDVVLTGIVEHVEPTSSGHSLWGRLDGVGLGTFTLVVNGSVVVGTVRTPDAVYTIRTAGDGTYVIRQIDESSLPPLGEPLEGPLSTPEARSESDDVPPDDGSMIDVMVVYTPLAKHQQGGRAAIEALIDLFFAETNQVNANSGVTHRIRLVLRDEVDYIKEGNAVIDLGRLLDDSDGYMDHVHDLRDLYAADLVHIVVGRSVNVCGVAASIGGDESDGFALTVDHCGGLTFAHELGHNMGLHHDRYLFRVPVTGSHYGYVNQRMFDEGAPESARWRTIMSYPSQCLEVGGFYCGGLLYFSNPEVTYNGDPMGVPADNPSTGVDGPADGVGSLNERREITANFRRSSASPTPRVHLTLSPYWLSENGGATTVTATLHRPSSADTIMTVTASGGDAVTLSGDRTLTIPAGQTVSAGTVTITGVDNGNQTGDVTVAVSATVANPSSLGVIEPEPVALAIADDETTPVVTLSLSPEEIVEFGGRTFVTAMLDNRSSADTIVTVSAEPAELINEIEGNTLTIPAGQTESIGFGVRFQAVNNDELAEATQTVTVSGTSENPQGVAGPENVTLTIIDDEAPFFAADSIAYTFTAGIAGSRFLPEAEFGNGKLTYSLSPAPSNDVTFTPEPLARIGTSSTSVAGGETSYTLTATDADGDTDTMTISITVRKGVCPNSAAVSGYSDPGIVHDCEALLASRDTLSVDQSLNWDEDLPIDEWKGVELANGRVYGLRMTSQGIVGTIPSELGNLSNLRWLNLGGNRLTGGIPKELGSLANLLSLSLSLNRLTGGIPEELGSLANLQGLDLWVNQLTGGIPEELGSLANLTGLFLHNNQLTGTIPTELGDLSNLQSLLLSSNQLTGAIPPELGDLSNLRELLLSSNQLTGAIPPELGDLSNLQWLYLGGNRLTGCIPDGLGDVADNDLDDLNLPFCSDHECVTGDTVPDATNTGLIADCEALLASRDTLAGTATLNWSEETSIAQWEGVRLSGTPQRVTRLAIPGKGLDGTISSELGRLSMLTDLNLRSNTLTGEIPEELGNLTNLRCLNLRTNELKGEIPAQLGNLRNLRVLNLHSNNLSGDIPDLSLIAGLEELYLPNNYDETVQDSGLTGPVPTWLNGMTNMRELWLWGNSLTGSIPDLSGMTGLQKLKLANNMLTGGVPDGSMLPPNMTWLIIDRNPLGGTIPDLSGLKSLRLLWLHTNMLEGQIPPGDMLPPNVDDLNLRDNMLTGEIPDLSGLDTMTRLRLHNNKLSGEIPATLGDLDNLRSLWLHGNMLDGSIPASLGGLTNLERLWLSENELTGEIPEELGDLTKLTQWRLADNRITGCVPASLKDIEDSDLDKLGLPICEGGDRPSVTETFTAISSGTYHTCALRADGTPVCWGAKLGDEGEVIGQTGFGQSEPPEGEHFVSISSGGDHTCALRADGTPVCWGGGFLGTGFVGQWSVPLSLFRSRVTY